MKVTMLLADAAQAIEGKLYVLGGGLVDHRPGSHPVRDRRLHPGPLGPDQRRARVPVRSRRQRRGLRRARDGGGVEEPITIEGSFEVGRPPGVKPGTSIDRQRRGDRRRHGGVGDGHRDLTAGNAHPQGAGGRPKVCKRGIRGGDGSRPTGPRFAHAPFMHPHRHCTVDRGGQHLDVDPLGELRGVELRRARRRRAPRARRRSGRIHAGQMRVADVDGDSREASPSDDRLARSELVDLAHLDADIGCGGIDGVQFDRPRPGQRTDDEVSRGVPGPRPAGSGRTPGRRCRTSARSSRRRCGSP